MRNFYTDVIRADPRFASVSRICVLELLEGSTRQRIKALIKEAKNTLGLELMIFETYRSQTRQQRLFDQGVTQLKQVGVHHYGLACDIVKLLDGEPSWKGDFSFLGTLARKQGLIWGGNWGKPNLPHSFVDPVHVQRCSIRRQQSLFRGEWYPEDNYDPYED